MEYDIKKGNCGNLEGDGLRRLMEAAFGSVTEEGDAYVSSYGAMGRIEVRMKGRTKLDISTVTDKNASPEVAADTIKRWNDFLERATGFTSKERRNRLQKKAKDGKL
ncbi:MAG: DUF5611 family protein [Methanomassiliicoccales archaeon]|jgi:hypothetical protein|nr:DUF5611 family protein [Methanomassiliicoccales archaeon]HOO04384.1 DUF5611 family protein [Methanomassiliicoccales archaeon]HRR67128.1 DUF5611 family protein [Methanomassiliicoccales archaeon]HRU11025.1 DUF5611 family protein [Methanomassiliicoccales archaeon]